MLEQGLSLVVIISIVVLIVKSSRWSGKLEQKMETIHDEVKKQNGVDKDLENHLHEKVEVSDCDKFQQRVSDQLDILIQHALED